eukprot:1161966-Pelagomonas_calceolata.AAC.6
MLASIYDSASHASSTYWACWHISHSSASMLQALTWAAGITLSLTLTWHAGAAASHTEVDPALAPPGVRAPAGHAAANRGKSMRQAHTTR